MSGFRDHFLDKYFGYRRRYVAAVAELNPERRSLAITSEIARLGFQLFGCTLVGLIFWLLVVGAVERDGPFALVTLTFVGVALIVTAFDVLALRGILAALADRSGRAKNGPAS